MVESKARSILRLTQSEAKPVRLKEQLLHALQSGAIRDSGYTAPLPADTVRSIYQLRVDGSVKFKGRKPEGADETLDFLRGFLTDVTVYWYGTTTHFYVAFAPSASKELKSILCFNLSE